MEKFPREQGIISLIAVFGVGLFALSCSFITPAGTRAQLSASRNTSLGDQAFYTAEAELGEGSYQYVNDTSYVPGSPLLLNGTSGGSIEVTPLAWPYAKVKGVADKNATHRSTAHVIAVVPEGLAFDYAVYAKYFLTFGGNIEINGNIFANEGIDFNGASADINGNAYSPGDIEDNGNIDGNIITGVEPIPPPEIDFAP